MAPKKSKGKKTKRVNVVEDREIEREELVEREEDRDEGEGDEESNL